MLNRSFGVQGRGDLRHSNTFINKKKGIEFRIEEEGRIHYRENGFERRKLRVLEKGSFHHRGTRADTAGTSI